MNTPDHCSDDTINQLFESEQPKRVIHALPVLNPAEISTDPGADEWLILRIHPSEFLAELFQTLALNSYGVYCVADKRGELCVAKTWRIDAIRRASAKAIERAAMTPAQRTRAELDDRAQAKVNDEMSRS